MTETTRTQRDRILHALAMGDGQLMDGFDMSHTAETMHGKQADEIELLIAAEQKRALNDAAHDIEDTARLLRGLPGDKTRRSAMAECAARMREIGRLRTRTASQNYSTREGRPARIPVE